MRISTSGGCGRLGEHRRRDVSQRRSLSSRHMVSSARRPVWPLCLGLRDGDGLRAVRLSVGLEGRNDSVGLARRPHGDIRPPLLGWAGRDRVCVAARRSARRQRDGLHDPPSCPRSPISIPPRRLRLLQLLPNGNFPMRDGCQILQAVTGLGGGTATNGPLG